MSNDFENLLYEKYREDKLSHVYLIDTNNVQSTISKLKHFLKMILCNNEYNSECNNCNICNLIEQDNHPNIYMIAPDGQNIRKEQIVNLKSKCCSKPLYSNYNVYIIIEAEKLNESSENSLLKFLEEPNENTLGFLISTNVDKLLETIISRCQLIHDCYDTGFDDNNEKLDQYFEIYLNKLKKNPELLLLINKEMIKDFSDKNSIGLLLKKILDYYIKEAAETLDSSCLKKANLTKKIIDKINYNVNIELLMDNYVLEMSDINE